MRIVVLDDYQPCASSFADWDQLDAEVVFVHEHLTRDELVRVLEGANVVVAMRERTAFDAPLLQRLEALQLLVTTGGVNASIDVAAARAQGVTVCGTRSLASPAAELTWALILAVTRQVPESDAGMRSGGWQTTLGTELAGKTLGLVGLGRLGQRVARVGLAFEMEVLAWSQNLDPAVAREYQVTPTAKPDLLARSDVVSLHLRLSDRTRGVIGAAELGQMKPSAYLVNTSRGPLVDEPALVEALRSGRIAGAGLDVYDEEPLPADHPLRTTPGTVLTPHLGYVTDGGYRVFYGDAVEDIQAWAAGSPVRVIAPEG
ncbi:MAG: D-2-hydroxyacid dehydrogenase family protein [Marmoricola sp.]|nr:D-2-hydroxyacid dehydrogenase family protein [Marmoricola sp.]